MVEAAYGTKSGTDSPIYCLKRGREANLYPRALYWILISHPSQRLSSNLIQVYGSRRCLHTRIQSIVATSVAIFTLYLCDILRGFVNENHVCRIKGKLRHTYTIRIMYMFSKSEIYGEFSVRFDIRREITGIGIWEGNRIHIYPPDI